MDACPNKVTLTSSRSQKKVGRDRKREEENDGGKKPTHAAAGEKREKETEVERVRRSIGDIFTEPYDRLFQGKRV